MARPMPGKVVSNAMFTSEDIEVYKSNVFALVDDYIKNDLLGDIEKLEGNANRFLDLLYFIQDNIPVFPCNDDINALDSLFNIYTRLCSKYNILPTLEVFCIFTKLSHETISAWINGSYRVGSEHSNTAKKWKEYCRQCLVNKLSNTDGASVNRIFIAKAAYGMVETAPVQVQNQGNTRISVEQLPRLDGETSVVGVHEP